MTLRGQILVSRTGDDTALPSVCGFKTTPCVRSNRLRVHRHHAYMFQHMCAWCRHTRGRFERTHGHVLSGHTGFSAFFFSVPQHTQTHTHTHQTHHDHQTTPRPQRHTPHNTQHHTETEREKERDRERERREDKTREDGTRQEDKRR